MVDGGKASNRPCEEGASRKWLSRARRAGAVCGSHRGECGANPNDRIAGFRVLQLLPGIGPGTAAKVLKSVRACRNLPKALACVTVPKPATQEWPKLVELLTKMRAARDGWPVELQLIRKWYEPLLRDIYDDAELRSPDIRQLEQIAGSYGSRERFLTDLAIDPPDATRGLSKAKSKEDDYVILSTIHSAKGQEYKVVRILNVVDGCIPSDQADYVEEERRLLYVAMTRAKNELDLVVPQRFFRFGSKYDDRHTYGAISRFIPTSVRRYFECRGWRDQTDVSYKRGRGPRSSASAPIYNGQ